MQVLYLYCFSFCYDLLQPYKTNKLTVSVVDGVFHNLENKININVRKMMLSVKNNNGECFSINVDTNYENIGSIVLNLDEEKIQSNVEQDKLNIYSNDEFSYIYFSEDFSNVVGWGLCPFSNTHSVSGIYDFEAFSYNKLSELRDNYYSDYDEVKKILGVPLQLDFSIETPTISMIKEVPKGIEVVSKEYVRNLINDKGELLRDFLIRVW